MSRRTVLSLVLTLAVVSSGFWTSPAQAGKNSLLMRAFKGKSGGTTLIRTEPFLSSWDPSGWSVCLIHEPFAPDLIDYTGEQPLPDAIDSRTFVGCDQRLGPGKRRVDFTAKNSPNFDRFVKRLTDGHDDMLWVQTFLVDDDLTPFATGGGGCPESCEPWKQKAAKLHGKKKAPDLKGFKIELIRLKVKDARWEKQPPTADGYYITKEWNYTWEIWGRKR